MSITTGTLLCILGMTIAVAAFTPADYTAERCSNSPDNESAETAVETYLRRIPKIYDFSRPYPALKFGGITFTALNITGLGDLWPYRPLRIYCTRSRSVVEASLSTAEPLRLILSMRTCSGGSANLTLFAASARVTAIFNVHQADGQVSLKLDSVYTEDVENVALYIDGLGGSIRGIVRVINLILYPHIEALWRWILRSDIQFIMEEQERE